jgi:hypothetical protein
MAQKPLEGLRAMQQVPIVDMHLLSQADDGFILGRPIVSHRSR